MLQNAIQPGSFSLNDIRGISYLQRKRNPKFPVPAWLVKAATLGEFPTDAEQASEYYGQLWAALSVYMKGVAEKARADLDAKLAEEKARRQGAVGWQSNAGRSRRGLACNNGRKTYLVCPG